MKPSPSFQLPDIKSNESYVLEEDRGKVIVLTFWTSWCPDCGIDLPKKEQLNKTMDYEKVKMIAINVSGRERDEEGGLAYTEKFLTQKTLKDNGREVYDLYKSEGVPTTVVIDQEGNVHSQFDDRSSFLDIVESIGELI